MSGSISEVIVKDSFLLSIYFTQDRIRTRDLLMPKFCKCPSMSVSVYITVHKGLLPHVLWERVSYVYTATCTLGASLLHFLADMVRFSVLYPPL